MEAASSAVLREGPPVPRREYDYDEDELIKPQPGRRIFVLSLQGDILQVYMHPVEGQFIFENLCCFDGKLLAPSETTYSRELVEVVGLLGV